MRDLDLAIDIAEEILRKFEILDDHIPAPRDAYEAGFAINPRIRSTDYLLDYAQREGQSHLEQIRLVNMAARAIEIAAIEYNLGEIFGLPEIEPKGISRIQSSGIMRSEVIIHPPRAPTLRRTG